MIDYIFFMHDDAPDEAAEAWPHYLAKLRDGGHFGGGSAIAEGICVNKQGASRPITSHLTGYIRVQAESLVAAQRLLEGNPVYEAGGTVEIRVLPRE